MIFNKIKDLEAICAPHVRLGNAGYPIGNTDESETHQTN